MSREHKAEPLDPRLQAWIDENADLGATSEAAWTDPKDAGLLSLLEAAVREPPREMSGEEGAALLSRIRTGYGKRSVVASLRDAVIGVAAVLFGLALGLTALSRFAPVHQEHPAAASVEIIKQVSFESIHEGKVVHFQLELRKMPELAIK
jgi:hypothetical protein